MNNIDANIFSDYICPRLTGKIIDHILLVNKHYNAVVKADMKHLYNLFWKKEEGSTYKDGKLEGEQLFLRTGWKSGQLYSKQFYKDGKKEGEQLTWRENGRIWTKYFTRTGNRKENN